MTSSNPTKLRSTARALAAIAALGLLAGCATTKPSLDAAVAAPTESEVALYRDQGWSALEAGRHQEALKAFGQVARLMPEDADAHLGLGEAHLAQNRPEQAIEHFAKAEVTDVADRRARALQGHGVGLLRLGRYGEAEAMLTSALAEDETLWRAHNGMGRIHDARGEWRQAETAYGRAIALRTDDAALHNNLGFSLLAAGDPVRAETSLGRALALDPALETAATNLRLALALQGRYRPAIAGSARQDLPRTLNNVAFVAWMRGDEEDARSLFHQAIEASPDFFPEARRNLAALDDLG